MLFGKLSDKEKSMIGNYIEAHSGASYPSDLGYILREWNEKKEYLYNVLGGNFIVSKDIEYLESTSQLTEKIYKAQILYYDYHTDKYKFQFVGDFIKGLLDPISSYAYSMPRFGAEREQMFQFRDCLNHMIDAENLASNSYESEPIEFSAEILHTAGINCPDFKAFKIQRGAKISKILGKIAKALNLDSFEEFRIAHSMCLNQKTLRGKLCLSIHPLDYMTMSDNNSSWTSCMSWKENGCYRQGTVEMMNSPKVVVAYLEGEKPMSIPGGYSWNNKKWRELFVVDNEIIANVKGYPYRSDSLETIVIKWLKELVESTTDIRYTDEVEKFYLDTKCKSKFFDFDIKPYFWTKNMYCDFTDEYHNYCVYNKSLECDTGARVIDVCYSGASECMNCGDLNPYFDSEECLRCEDCGGNNSYYCDECGYSSHYEDDFYWVDDVSLCGDCYDKLTADDINGERHFIDDMEKVFVSYNGVINDTYYGYASEYSINRINNGRNRYSSVSEVKYNEEEEYYYVLLDDIKSNDYWMYNLNKSWKETESEFKARMAKIFEVA